MGIARSKGGLIFGVFFAGLLLFFAGSAMASEIWVPPAVEPAAVALGQAGKETVAATESGETHFTFTAPEDYASFVGAKVLVIGKEGVGTKGLSNLTFRNRLVVVDPGGSVIENPLDEGNVKGSVGTNQLTEIDISSKIKKYKDKIVGGKSVISVFFKAKNKKDIDKFHIVGLRFTYAGPLKWKGDFAGLEEGYKASPGDVVYFDGSSYVASAQRIKEGCDPKINPAPLDSTGCWEILAAKGDKGDKGDPGESGLIWDVAVYNPNPETPYTSGSVVYYNGSSYICTSQDGCGGVPGAEGSHWQLLAQAGQQGAQGAPGISNYTRIYDYRDITMEPGGNPGFFLTCPEGTKVLGGGGVAWPPGWEVNGTYPYDDRSWAVWFYSVADETITGKIALYAVCATVAENQ